MTSCCWCAKLEVAWIDWARLLMSCCDFGFEVRSIAERPACGTSMAVAVMFSELEKCAKQLVRSIFSCFACARNCEALLKPPGEPPFSSVLRAL